MPDETVVEKELANVRRELVTIRQLLVDVVQYARKAESEIPEHIRRFMNYMHDVHDIKFMYEETGHEVPKYVLDEMERLHDRYRQLLEELHKDDEAFGKVRAKMAEDPNNRYSHTRLLAKPGAAS